MSTVTSKEKNMLMLTLVLVLYAVAAFCYKDQRANWTKQERIYTNAKEKYAEECALIAARDEWNASYLKLRSLMPVFPYDKDVDTHWLNIMDTVASENSLSISRRQTGKEEEVGDVFELPIDCKNWSGTLESLVTFLYGLRKEGAMVEVRQLFVRPAATPGFLQGTFSLHCAYMRGEVIESEADAVPAETATPAGGVAEDPGMEGAAAADAEQAEDQPAPVAEGGAGVSGVTLPAVNPVRRAAVPPDAGRASASNQEVSEEEMVKAALKALQEVTP